MSKFTKNNYSKKMEKAILRKIFLNINQVICSFSSISFPSLKLLNVIVFEISSFLCPNLQSAIFFKV